jgi:DNA-binding transcriptional LysR family regulator
MPLPSSESANDLSSLTLDEGGIGIAMPKDHHLVGSDTLDLSDLSQEGFIIVGSSLVNPYFPFEPRIAQLVSNISTQINLISVGMGVGLVVVSPSLRFPDDIHVVPLRNINYQVQFRLIWRHGATEPILQNFIEIVRELAKAR